MIVEISPMVYTFGFAFLFAVCGFMIARAVYRHRQEDIIENTIVYLVDNGFVKAKKVDGELEIVKLNHTEE